jgi:two-component system CheB/CheR fusion protein
VGIGASAGGLEAATKLAKALPAGIGLAFILVQHLDPTHASMMVELLSGHTGLTVLQATDGMVIERDHFYLIPPNTYLSVLGGALHLSPPEARHGQRLPFDFLLRSLAEAYGRRAICVILSGSGADGTAGLQAIKARHGLVIAQEPREAGYDGMPRSAIATGDVDLVLPVGKIPDALIRRVHELSLDAGSLEATAGDDPAGLMDAIIELLRIKTPHDFSLYKTGTLRRRIERRMGMAGLEAAQLAQYLDLLRADATELEQLGNDLLINVTRFFRDTQVFETLANGVVSDIVRSCAPNRPIRIWIAGCSTGEETYSIAMLFQEEMARSGVRARLQMLSSDVDPEAVATAREGLYPLTIEADVSEERLERFFSKDIEGYRVKADLRSSVAFTVHDLLSDPPFSRIDLISCRNLLIYLQPEAQTKIFGLLHFALREGGVLLLGQSETVGHNVGRFAVIDKAARLFRRTGRSRPGEFTLPMIDGSRMTSRLGLGQPVSRQAGLAELCRRLVLDTYAPAALLINRRYECLYSLGPTDRYLHLPPGHPSHDLLAMVRPALRIRLRAAIERACHEGNPVALAGNAPREALAPGEDPARYRITVQPVPHAGEDLVLVCFIADAPADRRVATTDAARARPASQLSRELEATRGELADALRNLETSSEEQNAIHEEALSVNEEFQSTNEELLTSKEELQSLNEELTALNGQLRETLERQQTLSNDLQNILYSTETATIFLDSDLAIRFFTPATRAIFHVIAGDVGRPLADLSSLAPDPTLLRDARMTLQTLESIEQEISSPSEIWYLRRVLPYRTQNGTVAGVVITYADITERKHSGRALEGARHEAEQANLAKSRFLAAASHDLRQPLQTLSLLQGLLAKKVEGEAAQKLVALLDPTLTAMSGMLNTLLDINQIDAGTVRAERIGFPIATILDRLREEFSYHAQAQGLELRVVGCSQSVFSDPRLLEQILRNLLSNAFKYTRRGKILLGCRRRDGGLSIEIWDTGIGIPATELEAIFAEYHQLDNAARERSRGLGLGLPIVRRLCELLGHRVQVRSLPGKGSVFAIEAARPPGEADSPALRRARPDAAKVAISPRTGSIVVIEDDPEVRQLLDLLLTGEGHRVAAAADGVAAFGMVAAKMLRPDLILADYNLPQGMNGLQITAKLRQHLAWQVPAIVLTGDIATDTLRAIAAQECAQVSKPVKPAELTQLISRLLLAQPAQGRLPSPDTQGLPVIHVVDDDPQIRDGLRRVLEADGKKVVDYPSCEAFLEAYRAGPEACLLVDAYLPGMGGLQLLHLLAQPGYQLPAIMITGNSDVKMAVAAMKAGAIDFIEKPFGAAALLSGVARALELARDATKRAAWHQDASEHLSGLTDRQRQIMDLVLAGQPSKIIAADLHISQRTVENHRAAIMKKTGAVSLPALARLALAATQPTGVPSE